MEGLMSARDVMASPVVTIKPSSLVSEAAKLLLDHRISALPVVDDSRNLIGIVSEGDLMHRSEAGTERQRSWWLEALTADEELALEYARVHARKVADVMTRSVITAAPDTPLHEIAALFEKHSIKRVPIVENGALVGIVSRANLIQAVASAGSRLEVPLSDAIIRDRLVAHLNAQSWAHTSLLNVTVNGGVVDLWGITRSEAERKAIRVAAESMPGVFGVNDKMVTRQLGSWL
jgi:CBS-domain-containing membrane protein